MKKEPSREEHATTFGSISIKDMWTGSGGALCFICETEKKGLYDKNGVNYIIKCMGCKRLGQKGEYNGETFKNAYTQGKQHQDVVGFCGDTANSDITTNVRNSRCVARKYRNDAMLRQIAESFSINL